jgi:hypothetical protein
MAATEPTNFSITIPFDPFNPDPWLEELMRNTSTSTVPEAARRAVVIVLRAVLNEDGFVKPDGCAPADAAPNEWVLWHILRGRVDGSELHSPGVLLVHEVLAGAAEEEKFFTMTLKARVWRDSGYDPEGLFSDTSHVHSKGTDAEV